MTCEDCRYFRVHYIKYGCGSYRKISDGHCVYPRLKRRTSDTPACQHFCPRSEQHDAKP